jgi:hypothetical protein
LALLSLSGCAADRGDGDDGTAMMMPGDGSHPGGGGGGGGGDPGGSYKAHLSGKVVAPEGTIPISGALVYLGNTPPPAIPDGVYCDKCVHLPDGTPYTTTRADGSFDLDAFAGDAYLVVQKGAFRRVRKLTIMPDAQQVPLALTTMPAITDKANGDDVPKIAVLLGAWDPIELVLARMGLKATITKNGLGQAQVLAKDAPAFAIYGVHGLFEKSPYPPPLTLITDPAEISKYHIVFIPCSGSSDFGGSDPNAPQCSGVFDTDAKVRTTLAGFVQKGGRVYVSDWSYEYVRQVFPGFVSWRNQTSTIGSACQNGGGDQSVGNKDAGLDAWLTAQGKGLSTVKDAWTVLTGVQSVMDTDADGKPVKSTPKVWVEADSAPVTTSFQHGCGRVLYTTYHTQPTAETSDPLEPQALALLYLILEIGVCIDGPVIG